MRFKMAFDGWGNAQTEYRFSVKSARWLCKICVKNKLRFVEAGEGSLRYCPKETLNFTTPHMKMKALVIYDSTGKIWSIFYGEDQVPQGLLALFVDIPDGGQLERIDVTNPDDPKPVFTYLPESDIGKLQNRVTELENQLTEAQLALTEQYEANLA